MSDPKRIDIDSLRSRLVNVLLDSPDAEGSLYLRTLGCCYLACEEGSAEEKHLEELYFGQCEFENVDGDDALATLLLIGGAA